MVNAPSSLAEPYSSVLAFRYDGALPTRRTGLWTGVGVGLLGLVLAGPVVGLVIGLAAGLGARHEAFRRYLLLGSPVALAVCALYVLYIQARWSPPPVLRLADRDAPPPPHRLAGGAAAGGRRDRRPGVAVSPQ